MTIKKFKPKTKCPFTKEICYGEDCSLWEGRFLMCVLAIDGYLKAFDRAREESRG